MTDALEDLAAEAVSEALRQAGHRPAACAALMRLAGQALARLTSHDEAILVSKRWAFRTPVLLTLASALPCRLAFLRLLTRDEGGFASVGQLGCVLPHALHPGAAARLDVGAELLEVCLAGLAHATSAAAGLGDRGAGAK